MSTEKEYEKGLETEADVKVLNPDDALQHDEAAYGHELEVTGEDLADAEERLATMSLERCRAIMKQVKEMHQHDQNFPAATLARIDTLLGDPDAAKDESLVREMKLEALLVTENSPYAEVRALVEPHDDPALPSLTLRVWIIGVLFSGIGAFVNQLFSVRQPSVYIYAAVAQLLAFPFGKLLERTLPDKSFTLFGRQHSLNPGRFNNKEHMLITIMATVAFNTPYTSYIVFTQALPFYFNQPYAYGFGYQILGSLGSNFVGYGLAGLGRRFIVFPSFCVWPSSLSTVALNRAFHTETNEPVPGPFGRIYTMSRLKFFLVAFTSMFVYWWFPGFIFEALSYFNWISWIAPNNMTLNNIVGGVNGLGLNPIPTWDFNNLTAFTWLPLTIPTFSIMSQFIGMWFAFFMIVAFYWTNTYYSSYLPINSNHIFDNTGTAYNVSLILTDDGLFDNDKYQQYSEPYMAAGNLTIYFWFFAIYACTISYALLNHRYELMHGFKGLWREVKRALKRGGDEDGEENLAEDIHFRLMRVYKEVPEWWYGIVLALAMIVGMVGVGVYPTNTTPVVVLYGIIMALIFMIPVGMIYAVTGVQVTMNVLAEFIGGSFAAGNALAVNYFKMYGYITTAQAMYFSSDLKLAHYAKIPPRHTFAAQMVATLISTFICTAVYNFQLGFADICTSDAAFQFTCPGENTFFTAAVFWGTIGPKKLFGATGRYKALLAGFPVGFAMPFLLWGLQRAFPRQKWLRQIHPVMICAGALNWAPYNFMYFWPTVPLTLVSWVYVKRRYLAFWSKYNYVLAAAWSAGIAVAAVVIFFAVEIPGVELDWWGNDVSFQGCEDSACVRFEIPDIGYFGPAPGTFN
ncbi:hypothetical protein Q5752_003430 [Cryptotrichosporon argae]